MSVQDKIYRPCGNVRRMFKWLDGEEPPPAEVLVEGPAGTGKSRAIGEFLYETAAKYPNTKILVLRRFRSDLHKGFQRTFEDMVLFPGHPLLRREGGGKGNTREHYEWDNGSIMVLGHMEDPQRWYSSEWDIVYWNEANESRLDQWERLDRSLRKGDRPTECPWRLKIADTNPDAPRHYINLRCKAGKMLRIVTRHEDNPSLEPEYLERLGSLTGVRYRRLYLGEWCAAEGQIWDNFDTARHVVEPDALPEFKWYAAGMDFGYRNPGCLLVAGFDKDGVGYVIREVYRSQWHLERWAEAILRLHDEFPLSFVVADSAEPRSIDWLNERLCLDATDGTPLIHGVAKRKSGGKSWGKASREHVRSLFETDAVRFLDDPWRLVGGPDPALEGKGVPRSSTDEIPEFIYKPTPEGRELPVDQREEPDPLCADHGCDALTYLASEAWASDYTPEPVPTGLPDFTMGALLKHDEVWEESLPNVESSFDDYTPSGAFIKRRL